MITITSKPAKDRFVVAIGAYMGARPGKPGNKALALQTYVHLKRRADQASPALPLGVSRSISVLVNVGQRIYIATDFGGPTAIEAGAAYTALTVRKCAVPKFTG
ncbi:MAG: hypothetical protein WCL20_01020 [Actinomycetes bacterium]|jgi:hypothetical protein